MAISRTNFGDSLQRNVVLTNRCLGCAACAVACPTNCLEYTEGKPRLANECKACGICANVCPQFKWNSSEAENFVFGREKRDKEDFGVCSRITVAKANDDKILSSCQDGGVVTALLQSALETKVIDGAIVSVISEQTPLYPVPKLLTTADEILESGGTRYSYSPNLLALPEASRQKRKSVAFVGTACQIRAVRRMQMCRLKIAANVKVFVGLMCSECFTYEGLVEKHLHGKLGINLEDIKGMNIKGKLIVRLKSGSSVIIPLSEVKQYARGSCRFCEDFSAELADVSAGGLGLEGWTFAVMRTKKGEDTFDSALECGLLKTRPVDEDDPALKLLVKLSRRKRSSVV